jgi:competence ComEA-like helix-hairpin-helix protein
MISFTKQERLVLAVAASIILVGSTVNVAFKKYPQLKDIVNLIESDRLYRKVDINTASLEELVAIPYIGPYTAQQILNYRDTHGPFTSEEQIKSLKGVREGNYKKFGKYLIIKQ